MDHPEAFIQPLNQSLTELSADIQAEIKVGYNLQDWSFDAYGIDDVLQAIDNQFSGHTATFYPAIIRLKQTLNTPLPESNKGVRFKIVAVVDAWLKTHGK